MLTSDVTFGMIASRSKDTVMNSWPAGWQSNAVLLEDFCSRPHDHKGSSTPRRAQEPVSAEIRSSSDSSTP
jgi:hypothetical protein